MKAHRLLNIDRGDVPRLVRLAPVFALSAAVTVVLASLSKALFLSQNPIHLLPWMFLGAAGITAIASFGYLWLLDRLALRPRAYGLFALVALSLVALRLAFASQPQIVGVVALLWCPSAGSLVVLQTWNIASTTLPTRQGKRLFPVLAAITTSGAVLGGLLVQGLLSLLSTEDLLIVSATLLALALTGVKTATASALEAKPPKSDRPASAAEPAPRGFGVITKSPMLSEVAMFVFLLQGASLLVDYQFSAELQPRFDKDGIARFLGTFYWGSNLVVLIATLFATSRLVKRAGIGLTLAASAVVLGLGSGAYIFASFGALSAFWVIAATAFFERVAQYAFTKPAMQMVYMPLQGKGGESAKALVDGVVYRAASALVSVLLLLAAPTVQNQFRLSAPALLACAVAIYLGVRFAPLYRRAIFEALEAGRLDPRVTLMLRDGLDAGAGRELAKQLDLGDPKRVVAALDIASELGLDLPVKRLEALARGDDPRSAVAALATLRRQGQKLDRELLADMLAPDRPAKLLRPLLESLAEQDEVDLSELARPLVAHRDAAVSCAACLARIRAAGRDELAQFDDEVASKDRRSPAGGPRLTGMTRAGDFARELPALLGESDTKARRDAIEQMGQLGLPYFIDPLIGCLTDADLRDAAVSSLVRYEERALESVTQNLREATLGLPARVALVHYLERVGTEPTVALLVEQCDDEASTIRDHAVQALWRMSRNTKAPRPSDEALLGLLGREIERLQKYANIDATLIAAPTPRMRLLGSELREQQRRGERRVFWLLGILYDRAAIARVRQNLRGGDARARSNALELMEQHIKHDELRVFVDLVEGAESSDGKSQPKSHLLQHASTDIDELLSGEPMLAKLWRWAKADDEEAESADVLERALWLKEQSMFAELSGEALLEIAAAVRRDDYDAGQLVYEKGDEDRDVFWVLKGEAERILGGSRWPLRAGDSFGLVAALDGGGRATTVETVSAVELMRLPASAFQDAIELHPRMLKSTIATLTQRMREVAR